ncbi:MAG TPA: hypothetical protein VNS34_08765 [Rhizobiaceae bacterium]|nr:hypothetical protein [Rhizobiaceae bacterium]
MSLTHEDAPIATTISTDERSYVDWPAILAGTVLASAIAFVLLTFGSAVGLSLTSAHEESGMSLFWLAIVAALWLLWVQISAYLAGGYLTGRLRRRKLDATEHESDIRDGSHGLIMWGLGVLLSGLLAFSGITGAISAATSAVGTAAGGAATSATADDVVGQSGVLIDRFLRSGTPGAQPLSAAERDEIVRVLVSSLTDGSLSDEDRQYLSSVVSARSGLDQAQAQQRVDALWTQVQQAEAKAREIADKARRIGMVAAFLTAAALLVSGVAAYYGAVLGGNHRDNQVVFADWVKPW